MTLAPVLHNTTLAGSDNSFFVRSIGSGCLFNKKDISVDKLKQGILTEWEGSVPLTSLY
jgi:hypothetical protein